MKSITLVVCDRPDYTRQVLDSIQASDTRGYHLFIAAEPGCGEVIDLCQHVDFMPTTLTVNSARLGIHWNNKTAYECAFAAGSEFNVALEDDTLITPDALDYANWFLTLPQCEDYVLANLFNYSRALERIEDVVESDAMCPWAWCFTRQKWESYIRPHWMCDQRGWDWSLCAMMRNLGLKALSPVVSRSQNIGRLRGTYCTPELHDQCFSGLIASKGQRDKNFRLCRSKDG